MRTVLVLLVMALVISGCSNAQPKSTSQTAIDNSLALASGPTAMSGAGAVLVGSLIAFVTSNATEEATRESVKSENNSEPSKKPSEPQ